MADALTDKTFQFELVSPEKVLVSGPASMVVIPGAEGDFGVLAHHAPFLSALRPGVVAVTAPDGTQRKIFVAGGFADVSNNVCAVLAEEAMDVAAIDKATAEQELRALTEARAAADPREAARFDGRIRAAQEKLLVAA